MLIRKFVENVRLRCGIICHLKPRNFGRNSRSSTMEKIVGI
jgi:hypothetical protein